MYIPTSIYLFKKLIFILIYSCLFISGYAHPKVPIINFRKISDNASCRSSADFSFTNSNTSCHIPTFKNETSTVKTTNEIFNVSSFYKSNHADKVVDYSESMFTLNVYTNLNIKPLTAIKVFDNTNSYFVTANNSLEKKASFYQWKIDGDNIVKTCSSLHINYVLNNYSVNISKLQNQFINLFDNNEPPTNRDTFYLNKSTPIINVLTNWGINTDGSGRIPTDFITKTNVYNVQGAAKISELLGDNFSMAGTLNLLSDSLTINPGINFIIDTIKQIAVTGFTGIPNGLLIGSPTSSLFINGTSNLYFGKSGAILKYLTFNGSQTSDLNTPLTISSDGVVKVLAGIFNTNNLLTLKSDINNTASIGNSSGNIKGKVTIERYIPARRAWRLITTPVELVDAPTINASWQEGVVNNAVTVTDPNPGYGAPVSGSSVANGFDSSSRHAGSIKYYDGYRNQFIEIDNTNQTSVAAYPAYFFFIRGNRSYNLINSTPSTIATQTTLRAAGNIKQGLQTITTAATSYNLIGNPFACPIDFTSIQANSINIKNMFYVWNPQLGGTNGLGAYVTVDYHEGNYTYTPSGSGVSNILQSGQAFFIQNNDATAQGTLKIQESDKVENGTNINSNTPFGRIVRTEINRVYGNDDASVAIDLKIINTNNSLSIADGVLVHYNNLYSNEISSNDVPKFFNGSENLFIEKNNQKLIIERRKMPLAGDTLKLFVTNYKNINYQLNVNSDFLFTGLQATLVDQFLSKSVIVTDKITYPFSITSDVNSSATNRFSILFLGLKTDTLKFLDVKATLFNSDSVSINWKVTAEKNTLRYEIERLNENNNYIKIGQINPALTGTISDYYFNDIAAFASNIFYRIKAISITGTVNYSDVVNVQGKNIKDGISIWPNPVSGNKINVAMQNIKEGNYNYSIINYAGKTIATGFILHTNNQPVASINFNGITAGNFIFQITQGKISYQTKIIILNTR